MSVDAAAEWNRLAEIYRQKSDDELEIIAAEAYDLTDTAREVLNTEIQGRRLPLKLNFEEPKADEEDSEFGPVDDTTGYELRSLYTADSYEEAAKIKRWFDDSGIATFIGDENVQELENFTGENAKIEFKVRYEDFGRAVPCLDELIPGTIVRSPEEVESSPSPRCPSCHSEEITFLCKDPLERDKFRWRCDACNLTWIDDGVVKQ
jgi:hypothetical protein